MLVISSWNKHGYKKGKRCEYQPLSHSQIIVMFDEKLK